MAAWCRHGAVAAVFFVAAWMSVGPFVVQAQDVDRFQRGGEDRRRAAKAPVLDNEAEEAPPIGDREPGNAAPVGDTSPPTKSSPMKLDAWALLEAGGTIGWIIVALSVAMFALLFEHLITIRQATLVPASLAETLHREISSGSFRQADETCRNDSSFLGRVVSAGLAEVQLGYPAVEKAMEDAAQQQAARLFRRLEYFTVIGTIAPMLGLLGTVWGMILAFMEFEAKPNPTVSELAPGIYRALVTTLQGLCVAIPSLAAYAVLRNRLDELVATGVLMAEHVFSNFKRGLARRAEARKPPTGTARPASTPLPDSGAGDA
jgi:biopolymer transport protein ExbB